MNEVEKRAMRERQRQADRDRHWKDVEKVARALERAGIWSPCGELRLALKVVPEGDGTPSKWAAHVQTSLGFGRYVLQVRCRRCGHRLNVNQGSWQYEHERKHRNSRPAKRGRILR